MNDKEKQAVKDRWIKEAVEYLQTRKTHRFGYVRGPQGGWMWVNKKGESK